MLLSFLCLFILLFILTILIISVVVGVPFVPTNQKRAKQMMELAKIEAGMKIVDLGSGNGRLLFLAAARGAKAVGYELNPILYWWTKLMILLKGYSGQVEVHCMSLYKADLHDTDIVFAFLLNGFMKKLDSKLFTELPKGAKIISYLFPIPNRIPVVKKDRIVMYQI